MSSQPGYVKPPLTVEAVCREARRFADLESQHEEPTLYGVTDGKAVGTYVEHKFRAYLTARFAFATGSSAKGIDFPDLDIDMKVTSIQQPQSSCPFKSARQKIFGLGYSLLVMVYEKTDDAVKQTGKLNFLHAIFVEARRTADHQMTSLMLSALNNDANVDDLVAIMMDRNLPVDDIEAKAIAEDLLKSPCEKGYLTISNALQWRLQYKRVIDKAGDVDGIQRL